MLASKSAIVCDCVQGHGRFRKSIAEAGSLFDQSSRFLRTSFFFLIGSIFLMSCGGSSGGSGVMSCKGVGSGGGGSNVGGGVTPVIALGIFKAHNGTFAAGSNATYTITVRNSGTIETTAPIIVTDNLPAGLTFISGAGSGWTCSATNGNQSVTCTNADPLAAGATSANLTLTVSIAATASGGLSNTATVDTSGNNSTNNSSTDVVVLNGCLGSASGNELVLRGQYTILAQGFQVNGTPVAMAASFTADGQGHITAGEEDLNDSVAPQHLTINSGSLYTVGSDNRACIQLAYSGGRTIAATFRLAFGGASAGIASKARIIEFDDNSGTGAGTRVSGILRLQDPTAFSPTQLKSNYALGADGVDFVGDHFALAGSINLASGSILYDIDDGLSVGASCIGAGQITLFSPTTGRGLLTLSPALTPGCASLPAHEALYVVNANEIFFIQIDQLATGHQIGGSAAIISGRAIATGSGSFSSNSLSGNYILHLTGQQPSGRNASVNLGLLTFAPGSGNTGTVTGTLLGYSQPGGAVTTPIAGASYTVDPASGRVTLSGLGFTGSLGLPPVVYVTTPTDGISAFFIGTDIDGTFGLMEFQPSQIYSTAAVAGTYFLGTEDPGDTSVTDQSGVATLSSAGAISGTQDQSGFSGLQANQAISGVGPVSINSDGTGNVGPKTAAITNGTKLFFIDESGGPGVIKVLEK
jgi:uncharacterized repeat protein (TIGR01451 family)